MGSPLRLDRALTRGRTCLQHAAVLADVQSTCRFFDTSLVSTPVSRSTLSYPCRDEVSALTSEGRHMSHVVRRSKLLIALAGCLASMAFGLLLTSTAQANWGNFCDAVNLAGYAECRGPVVHMNQAYAWGDQHSVCVGNVPLPSSYRCSSGPGSGVYSSKVEYSQWQPTIKNNAAGTNKVHGIYLFP